MKDYKFYVSNTAVHAIYCKLIISVERLNSTKHNPNEPYTLLNEVLLDLNKLSNNLHYSKDIKFYEQNNKLVIFNNCNGTVIFIEEDVPCYIVFKGNNVIETMSVENFEKVYE